MLRAYAEIGESLGDECLSYSRRASNYQILLSGPHPQHLYELIALKEEPWRASSIV